MKHHHNVKKTETAEGIFWEYNGKIYPDRLTKKNAMSNIAPLALKYCRGGGLDIGSGRFPFSNAQPILNDKNVNAYLLPDIKDGELDYIFSSHCMEHLERPWEALDLWTSKIKKGGILFLYLPHPDMELWQPGAPWVGDQHKWIPTFEILKRELLKRGYEILSGDGKLDSLWSFHIAAKKTNEWPAGKQVNEKYMKEIFKDKSVMILGSAPSVKNVSVKLMNEFDIICRVNNYEIFNECTRTDVYASFLGTSIRKNLEHLRREGCKLILCKCPKEKIIVNNDDGMINVKLSGHYNHIYERRAQWFAEVNIPYYVQSADSFIENNSLVGQVCTTGVDAILNILKCEPSKVYFAGFDFAMSGLHNKNKPMIFKADPNCHHFEEEFYLMKKLIEQKNNLDCSPEIKELFKNSYRKHHTWTR